MGLRKGHFKGMGNAGKNSCMGTDTGKGNFHVFADPRIQMAV